MNHHRFKILVGLLLFLLAACSASDSQETPAEPVATSPQVTSPELATDLPPMETAVPEAPGPTHTAVPLPTAAPTTPPTATPDEFALALAANQCLDCHTDKERLIEVAAPEEKPPSESSGVG